MCRKRNLDDNDAFCSVRGSYLYRVYYYLFHLKEGPEHSRCSKTSESCSVVSDSLWPHGLYSLWDSPGQNTGVSSLSLLQGIFSTQGSNPGLPHCRQILYQLSHKGSPRILEWIAYPFSTGSSWPRNWTRVSYIAGRFFTNWAIREARVCQKKTGPTLSPPERW